MLDVQRRTFDHAVLRQIFLRPDTAGTAHAIHQPACQRAGIETIAAIARQSLQRAGVIGIFQLAASSHRFAGMKEQGFRTG